MKRLFNLVYNAVNNCKIYVLSVFLTYCISCFAGIIMSHYGNNFALSYRDKIVGQAVKTDKAIFISHWCRHKMRSRFL